MQASSSIHIDRQLREIDRQIHSALKDIRKNLRELERVAGRPHSAGPPARFADMLRDAIDEGDGGRHGRGAPG